MMRQQTLKHSVMLLATMVTLFVGSFTAPVISMPVLAKSVTKPVLVIVAGAGGSKKPTTFCNLEVVALSHGGWEGNGTFVVFWNRTLVSGPIAITNGTVNSGLVVLRGRVTTGTWNGVDVVIQGTAGVPTITVGFLTKHEFTISGAVILK
jgi:hypothetical protein